MTLAWLCVGVHGVALAAMLLVLLKGMPPGDFEARREFVASGSLWWDIGWLSWAVAALTLVLFYLASYDPLVPLRWAMLGVVFAVVGAVVDWITEGIQIGRASGWASQAASGGGSLSGFMAWDRAFVILSPGLANLLFTLGGITLAVGSLSTRGFPRWLVAWGLVAWCFGLALTYAALSGNYSSIAPTSGGLFGLFLPCALVTGHKWVAVESS